MAVEFSKEMVPQVIYDKRPDFIELYYKAWEIAYAHIMTTPGLPVEHHMDEAYAPDRLWIWDTCFMAHYCKYAPKIFPGIQSMDNFYLPIHDGCETSCMIQHPDNPPLFAWVEYEYYRFTGDSSRIYRNLVEKKYLQRHYEFIENLKAGQRCSGSFLLNSLQKNECGYLWSGISSGMDNTPRGNDTYCNLYWIDILAQQALSALMIAKLAQAIGEDAIVSEYQEKYDEKKDLLNSHYYDEQDGSYYDIHAATHDVCRVLTPASFWPLLAEVADNEQAACQRKTLLNPQLLGGEMPVPSVARNSPYFCADGRYWRGGVWMPTSYMVTKSLEKYNFHDTAAQIAERTINCMATVYRDYFPATIWEAYAPTGDRPSTCKKMENICRRDFCGWSALGPVSMLIENVLGFHSVDARENLIKYHHRNIGRHGVKNFKFGNVCCDILVNENVLSLTTNHDVCIEIDGTRYQCGSGENMIHLNDEASAKPERHGM